MTSQPSGELGHSEPSLMDIAGAMEASEAEGAQDEQEEGQDGEEADGREDDGADAPDSEEDQDEEDQQESEQDPEYDVGESKVKLSELKAGYMKDADYRRKTAEVAETKRSVERLHEETVQQREYLAKQTGPLLHLLREQLIGSQADLARLANEDPAAWVAENQRFQQRAQMFEALIAESGRLTDQQRADQAREEDAYARQEQATLHEKLPEWRDSKVASAEQHKIAEYLIAKGYSVEELHSLQDHRALLTARDAMKWQEHQKKVSEAKAKQGQPTPPARSAKPGAAQVPKTQQQRRVAEASKRLSNNPNDLHALAGFARESGF